jgi:hypothetical protein
MQAFLGPVAAGCLLMLDRTALSLNVPKGGGLTVAIKSEIEQHRDECAVTHQHTGSQTPPGMRLRTESECGLTSHYSV